MHMAAELNGGVNLACLKTRIMMINVTAWKLITIVSLRFPIMPQTLLWKLIWIFHKSKRQSCSEAIWHVPSPVYISSGLAEELKNNHARCLLASRKRASPVAILFLFFFFCHITFKWKHFGGLQNAKSHVKMLCMQIRLFSMSWRQVLQHYPIYPSLLFLVLLVKEKKMSLFKNNMDKAGGWIHNKQMSLKGWEF